MIPVSPSRTKRFYKLRFYDVYDQYFTASNFTYPDKFGFKTTEDYMVNAANYGSIQAMRDLADFKTTYDPDEQPNFEAANRWLEMAAAKGDGWSMHNLGHHYSYGLGVPKDNSKAVELYLKASKLGVAASQNNLGWAY